MEDAIVTPIIPEGRVCNVNLRLLISSKFKLITLTIITSFGQYQSLIDRIREFSDVDLSEQIFVL